MLTLDNFRVAFIKARPDENDSYENVYNLHVNEISFSYEKMFPKTRFKGEAKDISKWPIQRNASAHALPRTLKCAKVITSIEVVPSPLGQPRTGAFFQNVKQQILWGRCVKFSRVR